MGIAALRRTKSHAGRVRAHRRGASVLGDWAGTEVGKQSKKTLLDIFGRYIEGYMTLFDTI